MPWGTCVTDLAKYNFQLHYQSGKLNRDVDALSRIPWDRDGNLTTMDPVVVQLSLLGECKIVVQSQKIVMQDFLHTLDKSRSERPRFQMMAERSSWTRMKTLVPCFS